MLKECIEGLEIKPDGIYVDGTFGRGGHSFEIASRLEGGRLICIDRDETALEYGRERFAPFGEAVTFVHSDFRDTASVLDGLGISGVDGMLFDLGVSSPQLDDASRGFSYMNDAPLDMRMDRSCGLTAYDIINTYDESSLAKMFFEFGEERYSRRIAEGIVKERQKKPLSTTLELSEVIRAYMPAKALREKQHPAKRCFQAIRIAVNDELGAVASMMDSAPDRLKTGGRLCVISFHSLEDRIVKNKIGSRERGCTCPREAPICTCGFVQSLKSVTRKPIVPSQEETEENPRARSAKLRVAERV